MDNGQTEQHSNDIPRAGDAREHEAGQATTEYALILLVAAVIALLAIGWATAGGGAGKIGSLFDTMLGGIIERATGQF